MIEDQELVRCECELRVGLSFIVGEFDFEGAVQELRDGADLTAAAGRARARLRGERRRPAAAGDGEAAK
jgi:hypothetical protein